MNMTMIITIQKAMVISNNDKNTAGEKNDNKNEKDHVRTTSPLHPHHILIFSSHFLVKAPHI